MSFSELDQQTITLISEEYKKSKLDWTIGYSGGKDSTALLKLAYNAFKNINNHNKIVNLSAPILCVSQRKRAKIRRPLPNFSAYS